MCCVFAFVNFFWSGCCFFSFTWCAVPTWELKATKEALLSSFWMLTHSHTRWLTRQGKSLPCGTLAASNGDWFSKPALNNARRCGKCCQIGHEMMQICYINLDLTSASTELENKSYFFPPSDTWNLLHDAYSCLVLIWGSGIHSPAASS